VICNFTGPAAPHSGQCSGNRTPKWSADTPAEHCRPTAKVSPQRAGLRRRDRFRACRGPRSHRRTFGATLLPLVRDGPGVFAFSAVELFNARGELIGITSLKRVGGENLNFAQPVSYVRNLLSATSRSLTVAEVHRRYGTR
jgi:hypothetical protein